MRAPSSNRQKAAPRITPGGGFFIRCAGKARARGKRQPPSFASQDGANRHFPEDLDISGNRIIASSIFEGGGAAYLFRRAGGEWEEETRLSSRSTSGFAGFGESFAIEGDVALVGVPGEDRDDGATYLFERTAAGWVSFGQQK